MHTWTLRLQVGTMPVGATGSEPEKVKSEMPPPEIAVPNREVKVPVTDAPATA